MKWFLLGFLLTGDPMTTFLGVSVSGGRSPAVLGQGLAYDSSEACLAAAKDGKTGFKVDGLPRDMAVICLPGYVVPVTSSR